MLLWLVSKMPDPSLALIFNALLSAVCSVLSSSFCIDHSSQAHSHSILTCMEPSICIQISARQHFGDLCCSGYLSPARLPQAQKGHLHLCNSHIISPACPKNTPTINPQLSLVCLHRLPQCFAALSVKSAMAPLSQPPLAIRLPQLPVNLPMLPSSLW